MGKTERGKENKGEVIWEGKLRDRQRELKNRKRAKEEYRVIHGREREQNKEDGWGINVSKAATE